MSDDPYVTGMPELLRNAPYAHREYSLPFARMSLPAYVTSPAIAARYDPESIRYLIGWSTISYLGGRLFDGEATALDFCLRRAVGP